MPRARHPVLALAVLLVAALSGCTGIGNGGKPTVVASFYPLEFVAQRIVGDHASVTNLTSPGAEPHDLDPSVRQTAQIATATVAIYEPGLQPSVDKIIANNHPHHVVSVTDVVHLSAAPAGLGNEHAGTNGYDGDPHFWQDPTLLAKVADRFAATMERADPKHAADYRANNAALQSDLAALDHEFETGLSSCRSRTLVVSHDAFEYLGRRYHLKIHSIAGLSPDAEPSPKHLQQLADLIRSDKITTVFSERIASPKLADALAGDLHIGTAVLDPLEGLTKDDPHATYLSLMRANLRAIQKADSCS